MKKVILFFAEGTEEIEALTAVDILRRAGAQVTVAGVGATMLAGSHGIVIQADASVQTLREEEYDMAVVPGGMPGTRHLDASPDVDSILASTWKRGGLLCAICAAPMILGKRGYLQGKRAICYPGFESYLEGAILSEEKVCRDGNVITGAGAGVALAFALKLVEALFGTEQAEALRASVLAD